MSTKNTPLHSVPSFVMEQTVRIVKRYSQNMFDKLGLGITIDQWVLLKIIHEQAGLSQKEIATESARDSASITRTLDLLEKNGFIARKSLPNNKRQHTIHLTSQGSTFVKENMTLIEDIRNRSTNNLSEKDIKTLLNTLRTIQKNMQQE